MTPNSDLDSNRATLAGRQHLRFIGRFLVKPGNPVPSLVPEENLCELSNYHPTDSTERNP